MRFKEFVLLEEVEDIEAIANKILSDCGEYLSNLKGKDMWPGHYTWPFGLWRRRKAQSQTLTREKIRKNRMPKNTDDIIHNSMDNVFEKEFGIRFRSQSIFAIGQKPFYVKGASTLYGPVQTLIFPIGPFSFCWSRKIDDFTMEFSQYVRSKEVVKAKNSEDPEKELTKTIEPKFSEMEYQTTDLYIAMKSMNEIMVSGDEFYSLEVLTGNDEENAEFFKELYKRIYQ